MPVLCDVFRKGSAVYFAGEVGGVKMWLNLVFEGFGCFASRKLWEQLYSDLEVLWQRLPGHYKPLILVHILPYKCGIFKKSGNSPQYEYNALIYFFWVGISFCHLKGNNIVRKGNIAALFSFPKHETSKGIYNPFTPELSSVLYKAARKLRGACCESLIQGWIV